MTQAHYESSDKHMNENQAMRQTSEAEVKLQASALLQRMSQLHRTSLISAWLPVQLLISPRKAPLSSTGGRMEPDPPAPRAEAVE